MCKYAGISSVFSLFRRKNDDSKFLVCTKYTMHLNTV